MGQCNIANKFIPTQRLGYHKRSYEQKQTNTPCSTIPGDLEINLSRLIRFSHQFPLKCQTHLYRGYLSEPRQRVSLGGPRQFYTK